MERSVMRDEEVGLAADDLVHDARSHIHGHDDASDVSTRVARLESDAVVGLGILRRRDLLQDTNDVC